MKLLTPIIFLVIIMIAGCGAEIEKKEIFEEDKEIKTIPEVENMKLTSPAFKHKGAMPSEYTCDGEDISPELSIENAPENAKKLALIMDDPDAPAGIWVHWVVWNIPPNIKKIAKGTEPGGIGGKNSWGRIDYGGPCPPSGTHRYFFKLYALDTTLGLKEGSSKKDLEKAMLGHIIEKTELMGTYKRK